jgi:hypothetical protein
MAVEFHTMIKNLKMMTPGNTVLKGLKGLILKFNNLPAIETDQVVMMAPLRNGFVSGLSISKFSLIRQTETGEELQGSVDRSVSDFRIRSGNLDIDLREILMPR